MSAEADARFDAALQAIAARLRPEILGTGPLAMLRRHDPARLGAEPALHRLLAEHVDDRDVERDLRLWSLLVHAMALAAPDGLRATAGFGAPLYLAGYSDLRMTRLLEARAADLPAAIPRAIRFLVGRQQFAPLAMAHFVRGIAAGGLSAEKARSLVARDYYRAERNDRQKSTTPVTSTQDAP